MKVTNNTPPPDWKALLYVAGLALLWAMLMASCKTTTVQIERTDTLTITKVDTFIEKVNVEQIKWRDRYNDRYVVVNALGDTVKDVRKEYIHLRDTVHDTIQLQTSNLRDVKASAVTNTNKQRAPPNDYYGLFVVLLIIPIIFFFAKILR